MDIIKLICDKQNIEGLDPLDIQLAINEFKGGMININDWRVQSTSNRNGIILFNEATYDVKTIGCVLNYFDLGEKSCQLVKGYFNLDSHCDCATCINSVLIDYLNGRIKKKKK